MGLFSRKKKNDVLLITPFATGKAVTLDVVPDQVFAQRMMGDGIAIEPTSSTIVSPIDGEVTVVFPTGHAYGITRADGLEVLVHLGIDTVELEGKGFTKKVEMGDKVSRGDVLCEMDLDFIREAGKPIISPMIITSGQTVSFNRDGETVTPNDTDVLTINM